jgi:hypothetical protein
MGSVELTAKGGGYYRVYVNGALFSSHVAEREAIERVTEVLYGAPDAHVVYEHDYTVEAQLSLDTQEAPPVIDPSALPESDDGMDLVDFLTMLDEQASGPIVVGEVIDAPDFWSGIAYLVAQHRDSGSWLFHRIVGQAADGSRQRIGLTWKGYLLLWHLRDRAAIRVGAGTE